MNKNNETKCGQTNDPHNNVDPKDFGNQRPWWLQKEQRAIYNSTWRIILLKWALVGATVGQVGSLLFSMPWPLTPLITIVGTLLLAYYKYRVSPGDLTDWQIAMLERENVITPFSISQIEPDSYDVLLGKSYTRLNKDGSEETWLADEVIIKPGECLLAHTIETFKFPANIKGILQGKSSWARLSLFVECAGLFDKGFEGTAVLELYNASPNPILLKEGDKIAQMSFHRTAPAAIPYGSPLRESHYQKQQGSKTSWLTKKERIVKIGGE